MNKIKMSDVFDLPLTIGESFCYDAQNSSVLYMDNSSQGTKKPRAIASVKAINAYDDNQKRIAELEAALLELIDTASQLDSWESFPSDALDDATAAAMGGNNETT